MDRRAFLGGGAGVIAATGVRADPPDPDLDAALAGLSAHWSHRNAALTLQGLATTFDPDLVVFGDSRIEGLPSLQVKTANALLWGYGGMTIEHAPAAVGSLYAAGFRPKRFVSVLGVNTIAFALDRPNAKGWLGRRDAVDVLVNMATVLSKESVICTVVPYEEGFNPPGITTEKALRAVAPCLEINALIADAGKRMGVRVFDLHGRMTNENGTCRKGYTIDGVHWSARGASALSKALAEI